jgi:hypothetical protein
LKFFHPNASLRAGFAMAVNPSSWDARAWNEGGRLCVA